MLKKQVSSHPPRLLFSRSYKDNLPSSLTRVISRALEYSSHPPVSVLVRSPSTVRTYFLEALSTSSFPPKIPLGRCLKFCWWICLPTSLTAPRTYPTVRMLQLLRQSITIVLGGAGIFNLLAIAYAFRPRLRDRLTQGRRALPWKPWIFGEEDFHLLYRYSCHAFSLVSAPALLTVHLRRTNYALLPLIFYNMNPYLRLCILVPSIIGAKPLDW